MSQEPVTPYRVADHLFDRLAELGCEHVFGVPGDYNMAFLDVVDDHDELRWVGNANELNASYAADAYARARGLSAMVTTFGVGELSAINGIAGSYAEYAPVLHIVGSPRTDLQKQGLVLHHSLGDGDFDHFHQMHEHVTVADAVLTPENAVEEIDRVLREVILESRPGYLVLAPDVALAETFRPAGPITGLERTSSPDALAAFRDAAAEFLDGRRTTILADLGVHRLKATDEFDRLLDATPDVPFSTSAWGKTLVNESLDHFAGIYAGAASTERVRAAVEDAEALVSIGVIFNDTITAGFSDNIDPDRVLRVQSGVSSVGGRTFAPLAMRDAVTALTEIATEAPWTPQPLEPLAPDDSSATSTPADPDAPLTQEYLWPTIAAAVSEGQTVLADQGTSFFGVAPIRMPKDALFIGQPMWGSIGYTLPACLGASLAVPSRRAVLLIGDGSAQLTVQEIGTLLRERSNPVIFLINNDGYTVEREIHGRHRSYNDIVPYDWQAIPAAFGGTPDNSLTLKATTPRELDAAITTASSESDKLVLVEVVTGRDDVPEFLATVAEVLGG
ncbi:MAG: alpha-keto acid decarboxylase family protein [Mycobacteriaceae bacterium]|uniref:alpha-keto acid decarboxylase family protein n=1 Tax=Corynebacterium sp. TaxID=1720 RepID=UPI003F94EA59